MEATTSERRGQPRVRFAHNHTAVRKGDAELLVDLCELSEGGAVFRLDAGALVVGDQVELAHPRLPDGEELFWVPASVVRLSDDQTTAIVRFSPLDPPMREDLQKVLEALIFERRPYEGHSAPIGHGDPRGGSRLKLRIRGHVGDEPVAIEDVGEFGLLLSANTAFAVDDELSIAAEGDNGRSYPITARVVYQKKTTPPADFAHQLGLRLAATDTASQESLGRLVRDLLS